MMFSRLVYRALTAKQLFKFASFPSREQMRSERQMGTTEFQPNKVFQDDLYYPMENEIHKKALNDLIHHIKTHPNLTIEGRGLCTILYLIAKYDRYEPFIFRELERHLYKFKESLSARLSFGGLYASYKSNCASAYQVSFFEDEVTRNSSSTSGHDAIEILKMMHINNTKSNEHKAEYFLNTLKPIIIKKFDTDIRPYNRNLYNLFTGLRDMKIYDEEVFELVLKYLPYRKGLTDVFKASDVYESLCQFKENNSLKQNLDEHISHIQKRLTTRSDFKWRYNLNEKRILTYDELVQNRDNYADYKDQTIEKYKFSHPEYVEKFILVQSDKDAIRAEHEAQERTRELENLVLEMFDLKKKGELSQTEDKNTLLGKYENIEYVKEGEEEEEEEQTVTEGEQNVEEEAAPEPVIDDDDGISLKSDKPKVKGEKKKKHKSHKLIQKEDLPQAK